MYPADAAGVCSQNEGRWDVPLVDEDEDGPDAVDDDEEDPA